MWTWSVTYPSLYWDDHFHWPYNVRSLPLPHSLTLHTPLWIAQQNPTFHRSDARKEALISFALGSIKCVYLYPQRRFVSLSLMTTQDVTSLNVLHFICYFSPLHFVTYLLACIRNFKKILICYFMCIIQYCFNNLYLGIYTHIWN